MNDKILIKLTKAFLIAWRVEGYITNPQQTHINEKYLIYSTYRNSYESCYTSAGIQ